MILTVPAPARPVDVDTFADITPKQVTSVQWTEAGLAITFAVNLSADEARLIRIRCAAPDASTEALYRAAWGAYQNNVDFLALPAPTQAQALTQVGRLTKQMQNVIRALVPIDDPANPPPPDQSP